MNIREATARDRDAILYLHAAAFGESEGPTIARLVRDLLDHPSAQPLLSLVAEHDSQLAGHALFTAVRIDGKQGNGFILAPLAVAGEHQKQGIGTRLIETGLQMLAADGADFVLVLGDPNYYSRTGFTTGHDIQAPYPLDYPDAWMAIEVNAGGLAEVTGIAACAEPLMAPEHW